MNVTLPVIWHRTHTALTLLLLVWLGFVTMPTFADVGKYNLGMQAYQRGDMREAARLFEESYRSFLATLGERHPNTLTSMSNLALTYGELGRTAEQLALDEKVFKLRTEILGEGHPLTLASMNNLAGTYRSLGRTADQLALSEKLLKQRTEILGERHPDTLTAMNNLAVTYGALGRTAEELALNEKVLKLLTEIMGERHPLTLGSMSNLADTYGALGRTAEQLALNEKVLKLRTEILGERHPDTLTSMNNLAETYRALGRVAEQLALNEKVLKLRTEIQGERHPDTLTSMNNLAITYHALGQTAEQLALNDKVLKLRTEILGERHPDTLTAMSNLALTYGELGRTAEQLVLSEKVLKLSTEIKGERHPSTLNSMNALAGTYGALGRTAEQLALDEKVLKLRTEIQGERHPDTLTAMNNLATTYHALGRTAEELALNEKVLKLSAEIKGERHPETVTAMNNMAETYGALGRTAEKLALNEKVLKLSTEIKGERHPETLASIINLALSFVSSKRPADAAALSNRYVSGAEWQRSQPGLSTENRQSVFAKYAGFYRFFAALQAGQGQGDEGFRLSELGKARTLLENMTMKQAAHSGALPAVEQDELDSLNRQVSAMNQAFAQARSPEARQNLDTRRNDLVRQFEALQTRLKKQYPKYAQLSNVQLLAASSLPGLLASDEVAVSYVVIGNEVSAFVVDAAGKIGFRSLGKVPQLAEAVEAVRRASAYPGGLAAVAKEDERLAWKLADGSYRLLDVGVAAPANASRVNDAAEIAAYLSARLLEPLAAELKTKPRWIVSPDGALAQLPFELLSLDGQQVLDGHELRYTQSLSLYALALAKQREYRGLKRTHELLAMGNPEYQAAAQADHSRKARGGTLRVRQEVELSQTRGQWPNLPGTEDEVKALQRVLADNKAMLRAQASEANLQALNASGELKGYRYLHFATHGFLSTADPALSSVVLSQVDLKPGTDGFVTAAEWTGYDLRSDLTVLSACDTGLGKTISGEGVMGLPFALFVAGSVNTVLSLWPVDDDATALFMQGLYKRLKAGQSAAQALTETKREFTQHPRFSHPSFWAPFVLVGAG